MRARVREFFFAPARPTNLGVIRMGLFSATATFALQENVHADARNAALNWRPTSFFRVLGGPSSAGVLRAIQIALVVAAILCAAGLWTRASQLVATPLAAYLLGFDSNFGKINHRSMLLVLLLVALLPARLGDGLSIDRLRAVVRSGDGSPVAPDLRYRWPVALTQATAVSVYFFAGVSKLVNGGPGWFTAGAFRRFLYVRLDQLADPPQAGLWLANHPGFAQAAAFASVAFELSVALVLVWPALKRIVVPGLVAFHESTRLLTRIDFTRTLVGAIIPLVDYERIGDLLRERWRKPRSTVLYDGRCRLCRRTAAVLRVTDVLQRLNLMDASDEAAVRARLPGLDPARCLEEMHLVPPEGAPLSGFDAFRRLAILIPPGWPLAPLLHVPGVRAIGRRAYARVARSRFPGLHCGGGACALDAEMHTQSPVR